MSRMRTHEGQYGNRSSPKVVIVEPVEVDVDAGQIEGPGWDAARELQHERCPDLKMRLAVSGNDQLIVGPEKAL